MAELILPKPLPHQREVLDDPAARKVLRWGRRRGKSAVAMVGAIIGHGPEVQRRGKWERMHRGIISGLDVFWLAPDYPQANGVWVDQLKPRFEALEDDGLATINESKRFITLHASGGTIQLATYKNIRAVRGRGRNLAGVIVDEAAHMDLEYALQSVLLPALADNDGWLILPSTTNGGLDGNHELRIPSYFNMISQEIMDGKRGPEWGHWYGSTRESPHLAPAAVEALYDEYREKGPGAEFAMAQELDAKLLKGGAGLAFPEWNDNVHLATIRQFPPDWRWAASMDWGYTSPGCFLLGAFGPDDRCHIRWEYKFRKVPPKRLGFELGQKMKRFPRPEYVIVDSAMDTREDGRGGTIVSSLEEFQAGLKAALGTLCPPVVTSPKGAGSRVQGKLRVHELLRFEAEADGSIREWNRPRLTVDKKDCPYLASSVAAIPLDPKNPEDVDTKADDHGLDALRYLLASRTPHVEAPDEAVEEDAHPGFTKKGRRRRWDEDEELVGASRWSRHAHDDGGGDATDW